MRERLLLFVLCLVACCNIQAQNYNELTADGDYDEAFRPNRNERDTLKHTDKEIPIGIKVWTVDERFGERQEAQVDTMPHMFQNTIFTSGMRGEYNTLGNLGSPRSNRIFIDRQGGDDNFIFLKPYDFFIVKPEDFHFTNTLSPFTNLSYDECGDKLNGEDHFKAVFGVNANKRLGVGFKFDYIYGRGYYQNQSTSHFNYSMYGSYLGDRYQAHLILSTNHQKVTENGGITDDEYITHPEMFEDDFKEDEIPTVLEQNWNRNDNQHLFLSHRYSLGFKRKVKMTEDEIKARKFALEAMKDNQQEKAKEEAKKKAKKRGETFDEDEYDSKKQYSGRPKDAKVLGYEKPDTIAEQKPDTTRITVKAGEDGLLASAQEQAVDTTWMKDEYVPVTSFIHTLNIDHAKRIYQAYVTPEGYFRDTYEGVGKLRGDSIYDKTQMLSIKNTFAVALLEGFNKWAKAGLKAFVTSEMNRYELPDSVGMGINKFNEHNLSVGGQLIKSEGNFLHYNITAETWLTGEKSGSFALDGKIDMNFRLFGQNVRLDALGFFHSTKPTFYYENYQSKHAWWNKSLDKITHSRIEGRLSVEKTRTKVRFAMDNIKNYTYFAMQYGIDSEMRRTNMSVTPKQASGNINLLTLQLDQDFTFGPLNWESSVTMQKSSNEEALPVPNFNVYSALYLKFKIAKVLTVDLGADVRYFTKYKAEDYCPLLGQYAVQDNQEKNVEVGNYPIVNVFANMHLKHTRFFVMMSHVNASDGKYFLTPHYPLNTAVLRFGVSWNFFN